MYSIKGVYATIQIPFNADERIDYALLDAQLEYLSGTMVHGLYSNGTAAEFYNQTEDEFDQISQLLAERCRAVGKPFQIGVSHMSPIISLERLRRSKALRPSAFQVIFPDWLPLGKQERISFLARMLAAADPIPLVLYLPGHSKNRLTLLEMDELASQFPGLAGVKIGLVKPPDYVDARRLNERLAVFIPGHHLATGLTEGIGVGSYSNVACINPDAACRWYETIVSTPEVGLEIQRAIHRFFDEVIIPFASQGYSDPALDKLLAAAGGKIPGHPALRWPYRGFDEKQIACVRREGLAMLPEFFE